MAAEGGTKGGSAPARRGGRLHAVPTARRTSRAGRA